MVAAWTKQGMAQSQGRQGTYIVFDQLGFVSCPFGLLLLALLLNLQEAYTWQ